MQKSEKYPELGRSEKILEMTEKELDQVLASVENYGEIELSGSSGLELIWLPLDGCMEGYYLNSEVRYAITYSRMEASYYYGIWSLGGDVLDSTGDIETLVIIDGEGDELPVSDKQYKQIETKILEQIEIR